MGGRWVSPFTLNLAKVRGRPTAYYLVRALGLLKMATILLQKGGQMLQVHSGEEPRVPNCVVHRAEKQHSPGPPPSLASQGVLPLGLGSPPWVQPLLLSARGQASFALQPRWLTAAWLPRTAQLPCCLFPNPAPAWPCGCFPPQPLTEWGVLFGGWDGWKNARS